MVTKGSTAYQRLRRQIMATTPPICWLCGEHIDLTLRGPDGRSWSLDHVIPTSQGGALLDPRNCRPSHLACNRKRQANAPSRTVTSRQW